ncbi:MAG: WYL domain-containing protein [Mariniphaga sp.]|nr:WYL domain-containing protein [Mariniphaga sp.]
MPINKHALIRYHALDRCFSNHYRPYYLEDLLNECNKALYEHTGEAIGVKRRQLFDDINFMESDAGWSVPLDRCRDGKRVYYRYADQQFSINNQPLNASEASQIKSALLVMSRFKGLPQFEWVDELIPVIENKLGLVGSNTKIILFDSNIDYTGLQYIAPIFHAIVNRQVLKIEYQDFKSVDSYCITFHPQILKQFNNRWFAFGINEDRQEIIWNMALDRMIKVETIHGEYILLEMDWDNDYFFDIIGVTRMENEPLIDIKLWLTPEIVPYMRTKPLHPSQKGPTLTNEGWMMSIRVIPNYELSKLLLSYGSSVRVVSPQSFKESMINSLKDTLTSYHT